MSQVVQKSINLCYGVAYLSVYDGAALGDPS